MRDAKKHLDMTDGFPFKGHARPADDLYSIKDEIAEGEMPLWSYRLMHWNAAPNAAEQDSIFVWIDNSLRLLAAHGQYPFGQPDLVPRLPDESSE